MRLEWIALGTLGALAAAYFSTGVTADAALGRVQVTRCSIRKTVHIVGPLMPKESAVVLPKMPSRVKRIVVRQGEHVGKGQPLIYLDADDLRLEYERSSIRYERALEKRNSASEEDESRNAAGLDLRESEVALRQAKERLADSVLRAPIPGEVVQLGVRVGDYMSSSRVSAGDGVILAGTEELVVRAEADEFTAIQVSQGQTAAVRMQAINGESAQGVVLSEPVIRRTAMDGRRSAVFEVVVALQGGRPARARVGTTAEAEITVLSRDNVLCAPINAIVDMAGVAHLLEWNSRSASPKRVTVGADDGSHVEILEGVSEDVFVATGTSAELRAAAWKTR